MEYIHGVTADHLISVKGYENPLSEQAQFVKQLAEIHVKLSTCVFDKIGGLYYDDLFKEFYIGPEHDTGKGPWTSAIDYYYDFTNHCMETALVAYPAFTREDWYMIPILCNHALRLHDNSERNGLFCLTYREFSTHNILVDENSKILAVIDFDGLMAAPFAVAAQDPFYDLRDNGPPIFIPPPTIPLEPRFQRTILSKPYLNCIMEIEEGLSGGSLLSGASMSVQALVISSLHDYLHDRPMALEAWYQAYTRMIRETIFKELGA